MSGAADHFDSANHFSSLSPRHASDTSPDASRPHSLPPGPMAYRASEDASLALSTRACSRADQIVATTSSTASPRSRPLARTPPAVSMSGRQEPRLRTHVGWGTSVPCEATHNRTEYVGEVLWAIVIERMAPRDRDGLYLDLGRQPLHNVLVNR